MAGGRFRKLADDDLDDEPSVACPPPGPFDGRDLRQVVEEQGFARPVYWPANLEATLLVNDNMTTKLVTSKETLNKQQLDNFIEYGVSIIPVRGGIDAAFLTNALRFCTRADFEYWIDGPGKLRVLTLWE